MDYEPSWCPGCDREIIPKRVLVPRSPPSEPAPVAKPQPPTTKKAKGNVRSRTGLLHGTGRVKPNGALKPTETKPTGPVKMRSIIDPSPLPLYCSDECRLADMASFYTEDYHPARSPPPPHSPAIPPPPPNSYSDSLSSASSDDSDPPTPSEHDSVVERSLAVLAKHYNFSIPPPPPVKPVKSCAQPSAKPEFNSGMIMAGRRIAEYLKPQPDNRSEYAKKAGKQPRQPVKGWDDGSTEWRAHVYNFTTPDRTRPEDIRKAYGSQHAFSHRSSNGVISTLGQESNELAPQPAQRTTSWQDNLETEELYAKFSASLSRKVEQRTQLCPASAPVDCSRRPSFIDSKGLLLPDIKRRPMSSKSLDSDSAVVNQALPVPRPRFETRAWSYDNVLTYPVPPPKPSRYEKRKENRLVDGVETEVEVEVAVYDKPKCLFNFPLRQYPIDYSRPRPRH